jgi:hypothetical protein
MAIPLLVTLRSWKRTLSDIVALFREEGGEVIADVCDNTSLLGASVYGHSGEFGPTVTDLRLSGRGPGTRDPRPRRLDLPS